MGLTQEELEQRKAEEAAKKVEAESDAKDADETAEDAA
jgi:hypothetical protein